MNTKRSTISLSFIEGENTNSSNKQNCIKNTETLYE